MADRSRLAQGTAPSTEFCLDRRSRLQLWERTELFDGESCQSKCLATRTAIEDGSATIRGDGSSRSAIHVTANLWTNEAYGN